MNAIPFDSAFQALTVNPPFPWQRALYERFISDRSDNIPASCNLPTGLGKTSVIAVWLIARERHPDKLPRRLVYVVNRRTVVDQTTDEVEKYKKNLNAAGITTDLALSTLRGQFADNREWSADPSRPAVICGTVDMIGSRLLFSGYGVGMKGKPLHAGFLGQDSLIVHDEAHLEPAFQTLLETIRDEQTRCKDFNPLRVMELTATSRGEGEAFGLSAKDHDNDTVKERVNATKKIVPHELKDEKKLAEQVADEALKFKDSGRAVLVFVRTVKDVLKVQSKLPKDTALSLTGTMRGKERDELIEKPIFQRFLPSDHADAAKGTVYLVCTSAGEVGVNISADHLVCDLSTFESMAQRFGRVNRFGKLSDTEIHIVHPKVFKDDDYDQRRKVTWELLQRLNGDGSPTALGKLVEDAIRESGMTDRTEALRKYILAAFAPPPTILPTSDILFDAWALTTIKDKLPGRPPVEPYLHGLTDDAAGTEFAWREEVELLSAADPDALAELLSDFPFRPHETLRVPTFGKDGSAESHLALIADRSPKLPVWVLEPNGAVVAYPTLAELSKGVADRNVSLAERTVVLPPKAGGLTDKGTLNGDELFAAGGSYDVAGTPPKEVPPLLRFLVTPTDDGTTVRTVGRLGKSAEEVKVELEENEKPIDGVNSILTGLGLPLAQNKPALRLDLKSTGESSDETPDRQYLIVRPLRDKVGVPLPPAEWPALDTHLKGVAGFAEKIATRLKLDAKLAKAVELAAAWHDHGKDRTVWQRGAGNNGKFTPIAKTLHGRPPENLNHYRHELGSMVDVSTREDLAKQFDTLDDEYKDVVLHLIATHHGRGRPHFPPGESYDFGRPNGVANAIAADTPGRFARLQRRFGRWGLAYLESLLRTADVLESQRIESAPLPEPKEWKLAEPITPPTLRPLVTKPLPEASISVAVDPTNPGQFFACCGLLELADRLWPGAEGWFSDSGREFRIACEGTLSRLMEAIANAKLIHNEPNDPYSSPLTIGDPFRPLCVDWWATDRTGAKDLKVWAGTMESYGIAHAMQHAMKDDRFRLPSLFDVGMVVQNPQEPAKKKEPYYFDARRAPNAHARDVGFSTNDLGLTSIAHPAVEFLCLVGLQVARPAFTAETRIYDYFLWPVPLPTNLLLAASSGALELPGQRGFRFENWFRTGQRKHKAFRNSIPRPSEGE